MAYTDKCDIFASLHEAGLNRVLARVRAQRPSLFNYATAAVASNPELLCRAIEAHPIVLARNNPLVTIVDPLPIPGTNYGVNFAAQVTNLRLDFHPGDEFNLPAELTPPLKPQRLALKLTVCGGIGCPRPDIVDKLIPPPEPKEDRKSAKPPLVLLPVQRLNCFCVDAYATGGIRIAQYYGQPYLEPFLEGFEIVDIKPEGLENSLECYVTLLLRLSVLPGLRILLKHAPLNLTQGAADLFPTPTNVALSPVPTSPGLPYNPALEENQLKAFIKAEVI